MKIYNLHEPKINKNHFLSIKKILKKNEISTFGSYPEKCGEIIKSLTNSRYVVLLGTGSSSLLAAFRSIGLKRDDLVITSNYTFIATINSIKISGGEPWVFDTQKDSYNLDLNLIEETLKNKTYKKRNFFYLKKNHKRIYSICPVYVNGKLQDFKRIHKIAKKYNLKIINDCAGSFLTLCKNSDLLKFSDITISSFNGNKSPSSGMGGCLISNNRKYYLYSKNFSNNFSIKKKYLHTDYGFNIRMTNLHSALLYSELKSIQNTIKKKRKITHYYKNFIKKNKIAKILLPDSKEEILWINKLIFLKANNAKKMIYFLRMNNIKTDNFWITMDQQPFLKKKILFEKKYSNNSQLFSRKVVPLPSSPFLEKKDIRNISNLINKFLSKI